MRFVYMTLFALACGFGPFNAHAERIEEDDPSIEEADPEFVEWSILQQKAEEEEITPEEDERRRWLGGRLMERLLDSMRARFMLEGEVVDQDGNLLDGVTLQIFKVRETGPDRRTSEREERQVDGTFYVRAAGYNTIQLLFTKEGYFQENVFVHSDDRGRDPFMHRQDKEEQVVERRDIRVVLEKMGDVTQLLPYRGPLEFIAPYDRETAGAVVIDFSENPMPYRQRALKHIEDVDDIELLPPGCLYIVADTDDDGRIAVVQYPRPEWPERPHQWPQRVRIIINDPDGGFVVHDREDPQPARWRMKRAPEDGYVQELILDADAWHAIRGMSDGIYFYFRTGDRYGKGSLTSRSISLKDGNTRLMVGGAYDLQADGSRNVDTGRR